MTWLTPENLLPKYSMSLSIECLGSASNPWGLLAGGVPGLPAGLPAGTPLLLHRHVAALGLEPASAALGAVALGVARAIARGPRVLARRLGRSGRLDGADARCGGALAGDPEVGRLRLLEPSGPAGGAALEDVGESLRESSHDGPFQGSVRRVADVDVRSEDRDLYYHK